MPILNDASYDFCLLKPETYKYYWAKIKVKSRLNEYEHLWF